MREIRKIRIIGEKTFKICFIENDKLIFETERNYLDKHDEALAFEMGLSYGFDGQNYILSTLKTMSQEEFDKLNLTESLWCGLGPRTKKK